MIKKNTYIYSGNTQFNNDRKFFFLVIFFKPILFSYRYGLESPGTSCSIDYSVATEHYQSLLISMSLTTYAAPLFASYWAVSKAMTALKNTPVEEKLKDNHLLSEEQLTSVSETR